MVIVAGTLAGAGDLNVFLVILAAWGGAVVGRQHLLRDRQVGRRAHGEAALPAREGPQGLRLGRAATRGTRELHHPHRAVHPVRAHRRHVHGRLHAAACPGTASSATTSSPAALWATYATMLGYIGGKQFEEQPWKGVLLGLGIAFAVAFVDRVGQEPAGEARRRPSVVRLHVTGRDRVPRLASSLARSPASDGQRVEVRDARRCARSSRGLAPDVVIHTAYRAGRRGRARDRRRRARRTSPARRQRRRPARPPLDRRRLRRPQGRAVRRGRIAPLAAAREYGRAEGRRRGARRRRPHPSALHRPDVADRRRARVTTPSKHELVARDPAGDVLRRRDPLAGAGAATSPRRCSSCARARRLRAAQRRRRRRRLARPSSPSSSPGVAGSPQRLAPPRSAARLLARFVAGAASLRRATELRRRRAYGVRDEPPRRRDEPVPAPARREPGRLVPVGRRGARAGRRRGPADPALGRLQRLPLVPRDGARVVRGRGDGGADERALRQRQGRPRGAARRRRALHGRDRLDDRPGRLADDGLPHARRASRSTPARTSRPSRGTGCRRSRSSCSRSPRPGGRSATTSSRRRGGSSRPSATRPGSSRRPSRSRAALLAEAERGIARTFEPRLRRLRPGAEVPARLDPRVPPPPRLARGAGDGRRRRSTGWPRAACTTSSAAASTATRSTTAGSCRTSRRCSTTTRCSPPRTCTPGS